jgi:hypothetical protein
VLLISNDAHLGVGAGLLGENIRTSETLVLLHSRNACNRRRNLKKYHTRKKSNESRVSEQDHEEMSRSLLHFPIGIQLTGSIRMKRLRTAGSRFLRPIWSSTDSRNLRLVLGSLAAAKISLTAPSRTETGILL